jgi:hypothetical protein
LFFAVSQGKVGAIKHLIENCGANVMAHNKKGNNILHYAAAYKGDSDSWHQIMYYLFQDKGRKNNFRRPDFINKVNNKGKTPLDCVRATADDKTNRKKTLLLLGAKSAKDNAAAASTGVSGGGDEEAIAFPGSEQVGSPFEKGSGFLHACKGLFTAQSIEEMLLESFLHSDPKSQTAPSKGYQRYLEIINIAKQLVKFNTSKGKQPDAVIIELAETVHRIQKLISKRQNEILQLLEEEGYPLLKEIGYYDTMIAQLSNSARKDVSKTEDMNKRRTAAKAAFELINNTLVVKKIIEVFTKNGCVDEKKSQYKRINDKLRNILIDLFQLYSNLNVMVNVNKLDTQYEAMKKEYQDMISRQFSHFSRVVGSSDSHGGSVRISNPGSDYSRVGQSANSGGGADTEATIAAATAGMEILIVERVNNTSVRVREIITFIAYDQNNTIYPIIMPVDFLPNYSDSSRIKLREQLNLPPNIKITKVVSFLGRSTVPLSQMSDDRKTTFGPGQMISVSVVRESGNLGLETRVKDVNH